MAKWLSDTEGASLALPFTAAASDHEWDSIAAQRSPNERSAFLVLETALDTFLRVHRVPPARCSLLRFGYPDDAGLVPPLDAPPSTPEEACLAITRSGCTKGAPILVILAQVYSVVVPAIGTDRDVHRVLYTPHLVDALAAWLAVGLQRQLMPATARTALKPLLNILEEPAFLSQWQ